MPENNSTKVKRYARHGASNSSTYKTWANMIQRCNNPRRASFRFYGALGVKVCERWSLFKNFLADMGERPSGGTLDRYPNKAGNYEPGNCRWVSRLVQARNTKSNKLLTHNGVTKTMAEWAEEKRFPYHALFSRLKSGWTVEKALETPVAVRKKSHSVPPPTSKEIREG